MFHPGSVKSGGTWQVEHFGLAIEKDLPCRSRRWVEATRWWLWGRNSQLVGVQGGKFRGNEIRSILDVRKAIYCSNRKLCRIIQPVVRKRSFSVHFKISNKGIPVCDRTKAGPRGKVDTGKAESGGEQNGPRHAPIETLYRLI